MIGKRQATLETYWPSAQVGRIVTQMRAQTNKSRSTKAKSKIKRRKKVQTRLLRRFDESRQGHFGDHPKDLKAKGLLFAFQNVNGVWKENGEGVTDALSAVEDMGVDFLGLTEVNANSRALESRRMEREMMKVFPSKIVFSSNKEYDPETFYQPGGIMSLARGQIKSGHKATFDPTCNVQLVTCKIGGKQIGIITVYIPIKKEGPCRIHTQSVNRIRSQRLMEEPIDVRKYVYGQMEYMAREVLEAGGALIIGGDFQEEDEKSSEMNKCMRRLGLKNASGVHEGRTPPSYNGGRKTIDHVWVSDHLYPLIVEMGYGPYNHGFHSDHQISYVKLNIEGKEEAIDRQPPRRLLNSKSKTKVERYLAEVTRLFTAHNVFKLRDKLLGVRHFTARQHEMLNKLDKIVTRCMVKAEQILEVRRTTDPFLVRLHNAKRLRRYWRILLKKYRRMPDFAALQKLNPGHCTGNIDMSRKEIKRELIETGIIIQQLREKAIELREKELQDKIEREMENLEKKPAPKWLLKKIANSEKSRRSYRRINSATRGKLSRAKMKVEIPCEEMSVGDMWDTLKVKLADPEQIPWKIEENKSEVEKLMLQWCELHFSQTRDTPLATRAWRKRMDPENPENETEDFLTGKSKRLESEREEIRELMRAMLRPEGVTQIQTELNFEKFREFVTKQQESKRSSPSGRHYGHMKTCLQDTEILRVLFDIIDMALQNGVVLERWLIAHDLLLRKDDDSCRIHRWRNITLVEADLQYVMKEIWARRLLTVADPKMNTSQNAKKNRVVQSSVLGHRLGLDIALTTHGEMIVVENDAVNCYDRIIIELAAIATIRMGMARSAAIFMLEILRGMTHYLVLGSEVTEGSIKTTEDVRLDGTGQGTGWSPVIWMTVFGVVLRAVQLFQPGVRFTSPDGKEIDERWVEGHVDDSRQCVNKEGVEKYNREKGSNLTLGEAAICANQAFERYLSLTGGKLAIQKTITYHLGTCRDGERYSFFLKEQDPPFKLTENFGSRTWDVKHYPPTKPHKMLGIQTAPVECVQKQVNSLKEKIAKWKEDMKDPRLNASDIKLSYNSQLSPKIKYPMVTCAATEGQLESVCQGMMETYKRAMKLPKTAENAKMHIPVAYGGYGLDNLHIEMTCIQANFAVQHVRNNDSVGRRLKILLEYHQLESGLLPSVLGPEGRPDYLTDTWALRLLQNLERYDIQLDIEVTPVVTGKEKTIMDILKKEGLSKE